MSECLKLVARACPDGYLRLQLSNDVVEDLVGVRFSIMVQHPGLPLQLDGFGVLLQALEVCFVPVGTLA